jgi:hypothetical protein
MKVALLKMDAGDALLAVPKLALTSEEVAFAVGSEKVFREMRRQGFLTAASVSPLLFDVTDVRRAWELWKAEQIKTGGYDDGRCG